MFNNFLPFLKLDKTGKPYISMLNCSNEWIVKPAFGYITFSNIYDDSINQEKNI